MAPRPKTSAKIPLGDRLKLLLEVLSVNQTEFCKAAGIDRGSFNRAFNGISIPRFDAIEAIYLAYPQLNAQWLLNGKGEPLGSPVLEATTDCQKELAHAQEKLILQARLIDALESALRQSDATANQKNT